MRPKVRDKREASDAARLHAKKSRAGLVKRDHALYGSSTEAVQRLIIVADHCNIVRDAIRKSEIDLLLNEVSVLVL